MEVVSVNRGDKKEVIWQGKKVLTGIFKSPVRSILLGKEDVVDDDVVDRRYHGGIDKAVYAYNADYYPFWTQLFPNINHDYGMMGENITISGMNENEIRIGAKYQIGEAEIEVSQPRQPCFKLGIRFQDQSVLKKFIQSGYSGIYFRVLKEGVVTIGDKLILLEETASEPFVMECHQVNYKQTTDMLVAENVKKSSYLSKSYLT